MSFCFEKKILQRIERGNIRSLKTVKNLVDFASNDYLGLSNSLELTSKIQQKFVLNFPSHRVGSTGSRLLTGNSTYAEELEKSIAFFHHQEAGILFNCGYMANLGLFSTAMDLHDNVFFDTFIHASIKDGIRLSGANAFAFRHNDLEHLENRLKNSTSCHNFFICIESIYSTDGSKAPLKEICELANKYGAHVIVDEAHAVGVCGPQGKGMVSELNLSSKIFAQIITFGKAIGTHGAIVLGNQKLKDALINFAHSFIYTTALSPYSLVAIESAYELFPTFERERKHLNHLIKIFKETQKKFSTTHIQPILISENHHAKKFATFLSIKGFDVRALLSPTVQRGKEILRICLHAFNCSKDLIYLLNLINSYKKDFYE